jgi:hypothetical protein
VDEAGCELCRKQSFSDKQTDERVEEKSNEGHITARSQEPCFLHMKVNIYNMYSIEE